MHPVGEGHPDYELLFSILGSLRLDNEKRSMIEHNRTEGDIRDIEADAGQMSTDVEIRYRCPGKLLALGGNLGPNRRRHLPGKAR